MSEVRLLDYWSPPDGAGAPVACLATTFTFDADFFMRDCAARFLGLSATAGEGDRISSIVAVLEEAERLSEAPVSVLVDRSSPAEKRSLRWDLLPVAVPRGLLHAKVAVLLWQRHARVVIGSANLTEPGYRRQIEMALAIDLTEDCQVPRPFLDELARELDDLITLAGGPADTPPKQRAAETVRRLADRVAAIDLPTHSTTAVRIALASSRPGAGPLDRYADVWRGNRPLRATLLSPYWDENPSGVLDAATALLTGRPADERRLTLRLPTDPFTGRVRAPEALADCSKATLTRYRPLGEDGTRGARRLHAKLVFLESDEWVAAMIGSSNATGAGWGLTASHGHREANVWVGCAANSATAKALRVLAGAGDPIPPGDLDWEPMADEDEPPEDRTLLPLGFADCLLRPGPPVQAVLTLDPSRLPADWRLRLPGGSEVVADAGDWLAAGRPYRWELTLGQAELPAYLTVGWLDGAGDHEATWTANVEDRATLPCPDELARLPVEVILAALASTQPLSTALERELRRREKRPDDLPVYDPLRRFDSEHLLRRARHQSLALWRLQQRLSRPARTFDSLHWRLKGAVGPVQVAESLAGAVDDHRLLPGEAHFLLAELALTVGAVDWSTVTSGLDSARVEKLLADVIDQLCELRSRLPAPSDPALEDYVRDAMAEVRR
jgi:hypothetical protein